MATKLHGIPVSTLADFPQWILDQPPVRLDSLKLNETFCTLGKAYYRKGTEHISHSGNVYHATELWTGYRDTFAASSLVWKVEPQQ